MEKVSAKMEKDQHDGELLATNGIWKLLTVGLISLALVGAFTFVLRQSISRTEGVLLENAAKLNAMDHTNARIEFKMDGTILAANDIFLNAMATGWMRSSENTTACLSPPPIEAARNTRTFGQIESR